MSPSPLLCKGFGIERSYVPGHSGMHLSERQSSRFLFGTNFPIELQSASQPACQVVEKEVVFRASPASLSEYRGRRASPCICLHRVELPLALTSLLTLIRAAEGDSRPSKRQLIRQRNRALAPPGLLVSIISTRCHSSLAFGSFSRVVITTRGSLVNSMRS